MNRDTVLKCAEIAAAARMASIGYVDPDIAELLEELKPAPELSLVTEPEAPAEEPVAKKAAKKSAAKEPAAE